MIDAENLKSIERLHEMKEGGIISDEEFVAAKQRLLHGKRRPSIVRTLTSEPQGAPAADDYLGWMILPLRRYAEFDGRSSRKEFWLFQLFVSLVILSLILLTVITFGLGAILLAIALVGAIVPLIAVEVRRFHDQDRSGWFALLNLIPYAGGIIVLIFMLLPGTDGENQFGADPLS